MEVSNGSVKTEKKKKQKSEAKERGVETRMSLTGMIVMRDEIVWQSSLLTKKGKR